MTLNDKTVIPLSDQNLVCSISGLAADTPVTWIGPDNKEIPTDDTNNYIISQGEFVISSKASTLTITRAKLSTLSSGSVFKCQLKSAFYPENSPVVQKEMTLNFFTLGKFYSQSYFNKAVVSTLSCSAKTTNAIAINLKKCF